MTGERKKKYRISKKVFAFELPYLQLCIWSFISLKKLLLVTSLVLETEAIAPVFQVEQGCIFLPRCFCLFTGLILLFPPKSLNLLWEMLMSTISEVCSSLNGEHCENEILFIFALRKQPQDVSGEV